MAQSPIPGATLPPGLPDPAVLARLAGAFFAALPRSAPAPVPADPQPPGLSPPPGAAGPSTPAALPFGAMAPGANLVPTSPQAPANALASAPALLPHAQAPNGVPDHALVAAPALDGRLGSQLLGVPAAPTVPHLGLSAGALPAGAPPAWSAPAAAGTGPRFYFIDAPAAAPAAPLVAASPARPGFDVHAVRRDFPILRERVNGRQLVWFDNAATTQKPQAVIDRIAHFYAHENSNIHRAAHELAARATDAYKHARGVVRRFIGAAGTDEIIFVRGTTEAINLVAKSWGVANVGAGDEIIVSHLEHHANIVPWQQLAAQVGARIRVIPVDNTGQVRLDAYAALLNDRTKIVSVTQVSNALGTVVPVQEIVALARGRGITTLVDGAQSVSHLQTVYHGPPTRFEAGTGNIADAVGLGAALEYVERIGIEAIGAYEHALLEDATAQLRPIPGVRLIGTAAHKASVLSFVLDGHSTDQVGRALNQEGIAVRTGHHCAQPILRRFGLETTVRPSLAFYNTGEEVDRMVAVVRRLAGR